MKPLFITLCIVFCIIGGLIGYRFLLTNQNTQQNKLLTITVVVRGGGHPLPDLQVELYEKQFTPVPGRLVASAATDTQGKVEFQVPPGTYGFWIRSTQMSAQWGYGGPTKYTFMKDQVINVLMKSEY